MPELRKWLKARPSFGRLGKERSAEGAALRDQRNTSPGYCFTVEILTDCGDEPRGKSDDTDRVRPDEPYPLLLRQGQESLFLSAPRRIALSKS